MNSESVTTCGSDSVSIPQNSQEIYEREERIVVDYSNLPDKYKNLLVSDEIRREGDLLERRVNELSHTVQHNKAPNMRAVEKI
ncbi:structural maintenance of chromosomes protein 1A-like [Daphnia pulex]|uniref:structural maintenance of chromosomes protein 1A-like n=1 Tax=Daphnia pulex TaxID=6669 RepID=UPI001EE08572|nr:structural maintenance of chromosomes protein 1A-like [Daphnia pulex]